MSSDYLKLLWKTTEHPKEGTTSCSYCLLLALLGLGAANEAFFLFKVCFKLQDNTPLAG